MVNPYLNHIATAVPDYDIHHKFIDYAQAALRDNQNKLLFKRMANRCQIERRYSFLKPHTESDQIDADGFYQSGSFPLTSSRMAFYQKHALTLVRRALDQLDIFSIKESITHLIITTCTGFHAPGIDLQIINHYGLKSSIERIMIGFMGCQAGITALKMAYHIIKSNPLAKVLIVNLELCTLHLQETENLEHILSFLIFADGCAASLISAEPRGIELQSFHSAIVPDSQDYITWSIGDSGFNMHLSGQVPQAIMSQLPTCIGKVLSNKNPTEIAYWAIHPGGRSILDAVRDSIGFPEEALFFSRNILRRFGNMSSATIMFVLRDMIEAKGPDGLGCALAFGPGLTVEGMLFCLAARNDTF